MKFTLIMHGLILQAMGIPGGFLIGGLSGWHMGNPQAWVPILKGASLANSRLYGQKTKGIRK
jgi:hypothetical protein